MHICFITSEYPKKGFPHGGVGTFITTISKALAKENIKVSVVGINYENRNQNEVADGIAIYRLKPFKIRGLTWFLNSNIIKNKIQQIHKESPIDIVESAELGLAFLAKIKEIKYIIRLHGGHHFFAEGENRGVNKWKGLQEKRSFKKADAFIAVSKYVEQHTAKYLSYNSKMVSIINYPVSFSRFFPKENCNVIDQSIVFAGTVCEKKGIRQLIQAFPEIKMKFPKATLQIYGRDWKFPHGGSFIQMLKEKELPLIGSAKEAIHFHGAVNHEELSEIYQSAAVCAFPSHVETQGLVVPEAMAMEKPVIFSKLGPGPETIIDYETGLLCNSLDPKDIAEKIMWVFENQSEAAQIGKKARMAAVAKFNPEKIVAQNIAFYTMIIQK
jgi:glycosyltransferase involved in cell wall biosynthesis